MDVCKTCVFNKSLVCTRISNIELKTRINHPYKYYEAYKICKGYFYEPKKKVCVQKPEQTSK